jgi:diacylglycerol kinase (ATP)
MEPPSASPGCPLIILNPAANRGNMQMYRDLLQKRAEFEQAEYCETASSAEAEARARQAAEQGRSLIIAGGDGSINEIVNGLLTSGQRVPLGIIAAGSGNDFAWNTLQLPRDPLQAIERAFHGTPVEVDVGQVNGRYFLNAFSLGLDADIAVAANRLKRWPLMSGGRLYYGATLKQLFFGYHHCPWLSCVFDETTQVEMTRYVLLAVNNGPTYGGGFRINPAAHYNDGLLDVCAIRHMPLARALRLLPVMKRGEHTHIPEAHFWRVKTLRIESNKPVNMQMDGETTCTEQYSAAILPGALLIRV